jgi:hypothetical protein
MHRNPWYITSLMAAVLLCCDCGGGSPATPTPTPPVVANPTPVPPSAVTFTGRVTATNGQQALPNVMASFGPAIRAVTDSAGTFTMRFQPGTTSRLTLEGETIVPRSLVASVNETRTLDLNAITLTGSFDLAYYRELVRDAADSPGVLRPLRRWTRAPSLYVRTVDTQGRLIDTVSLDAMIPIMTQAISEWTNNAFQPAVTRGTETREGQTGWMTVKWLADPSEDPTACGRATVGQDGGWVQFNYRLSVCRCAGGGPISDATIRHEFGHAMGFWHTATRGDLLYGGGTEGRCGLMMTARERYHAAIAYQRPIGNTDPDTDPSDVVNLAPLIVR